MTKPRCQGKTKKGQSCSRNVPVGSPYCWQHQSDETEMGEDVYERLEKATPTERTGIVLRFIEAHPEGRLELPIREGVRANLQGIDLSHDTLKIRRAQCQQSPSWWIDRFQEVNLRGANLQGADLKEANLQGAKLGLANLQGAILWKANFQTAVLRGANLQDAFLLEANLQKADLREANLQGATLEQANLQGAILVEANLQEANLQGAALKGTNLQEAILIEANLQETFLREAKLQKADLREAKLQGAELWYADLQGAVLKGADLQGAVLKGADLQGADLRGANLQETNLVETNLQRADLRAANLQGSDLENANLQEAELGYVNFQGAELWGVDLWGAILKGAKLQQVDLLNCRSIAHIYIENVWLDHTRLRQDQLGGAIGEELAAKNKQLTAQERTEKYAVAKHGYLALKQNFDNLGDYEASSWAYRKERRMEKLEAREAAKAAFSERRWSGAISTCTKYLGDKIVEILSDYGEGFGRVLAWIAAFIFVIGPALFWTFGKFEWTESSQAYYFSRSYRWQQHTYTYYQLLLYTIDTFTTANFAELKPVNAAARLVSGALAMFGIFLVGLLGFVAGNRIRRL